MLSRVVAPVGALMAMAPLVVSAEAPKSPRKMMRPSELPIYGAPPPPKLVYIPTPENSYTRAVSKGRKALWNATSGVHGTINYGKKTFYTVKEYLKEAKTHVQEDSSGIQRASLITIAAFGGIVAGYKGGILRKALLGSSAMTVAAAVCYPNQAVDIASTGLTRVKQEGCKIWNKGTYSFSKIPTLSDDIGKPEDKIKKDEESSTMPSKTPPSEDPGQSRPEDKDLYSSRS